MMKINQTHMNIKVGTKSWSKYKLKRIMGVHIIYVMLISNTHSDNDIFSYLLCLKIHFRRLPFFFHLGFVPCSYRKTSE